ncbi:MAG: metalloregulator ArsR/SmtB family transcription factor [Lentisphaeria bacterium]
MSETMNKQQLATGAKVMRALAHPVRLGVLQCLHDGKKTVNELAHMLDCSQSMMSQQLAILESQEIISSHKSGTTKYCSLRNPAFMDMYKCLHEHMLKYLRVGDKSTDSGS